MLRVGESWHAAAAQPEHSELRAATVVAPGLNGIDQIALDEAHGFAYVADLLAAICSAFISASGKTAVAIILAARCAITGDGRFAHLSSDLAPPLDSI